MSAHKITFRRAVKPGLAAMTALALLMGAAQAGAEPMPYKTISAQAPGPSGKTQVLRLPKGRSAVIDLPVDAADVFVSNPAVADAVLRTPRRIFVLGVEGGQSDAIFFDAGGRQILNLSIRVEAATDELGDTMHRLFPNSHVEVQSLNGKVVLSGLAQSDGQADQILRLATTYVTKPEDIINLMSIAGKDQVTLKVRIVEVNRSAIKQLGLTTDVTYNMGTQSYSFGRGNSYGVNGSYQGGKGLCYGQDNTRTTNFTNDSSTNNTSNVTSSNSSTLGENINNIIEYNPDGSPRDTLQTLNGRNTNSSTTGSDSTLSTVIGATVSTAFKRVTGSTNATCLQAFERVGLIRTLAEPNLTAISGESAKFLAGGEFPVPVAQDAQGRITVEFKPFGVGLGFTPIVLSNGRISLKLSTEISEVTNIGAFSVNNLTIPGLSVRRAETSVEMQSGSSLMIAGLLQSKYKQTIDSLPGLTSLPVLGSLFRSRDFLNDDSEMVVIITPYIVDPVHPDELQTPADNLQPAGDATSVFMGRLNRVIAADKGGNGGGTATAATAPAGPYTAPIGYVIE